MAASPTMHVRDSALQLLAGFWSGMPVAEADGAVLGVIVVEFDPIRALRQGKALERTTAREIITTSVRTVGVDTSLKEVMEKLHTHELRVPVTDHGKPVGIISRADVLQAVNHSKFLQFDGEPSL